MNLARAYEAVVGALLEDRGLRDTERFVLRTLKADLAIPATLSAYQSKRPVTKADIEALERWVAGIRARRN